MTINGVLFAYGFCAVAWFTLWTYLFLRYHRPRFPSTPAWFMIGRTGWSGTSCFVVDNLPALGLPGRLTEVAGMRKCRKGGCETDAQPINRYCTQHRQEERDRMRTLYTERKARGICVRCRAPIRDSIGGSKNQLVQKPRALCHVCNRADAERSWARRDKT